MSNLNIEEIVANLPELPDEEESNTHKTMSPSDFATVHYINTSGPWLTDNDGNQSCDDEPLFMRIELPSPMPTSAVKAALLYAIDRIEESMRVVPQEHGEVMCDGVLIDVFNHGVEMLKAYCTEVYKWKVEVSWYKIELKLPF